MTVDLSATGWRNCVPVHEYPGAGTVWGDFGYCWVVGLFSVHVHSVPLYLGSKTAGVWQRSGFQHALCWWLFTNHHPLCVRVAVTCRQQMHLRAPTG